MDFMQRLEEKKRQEQFEKDIQTLQEVLSLASLEEKKEIFQAIENEDFDLYMSLCEPIILRFTMIQLNKKK